MSPTVFRYKGYRFFFFSREEQREHIHVTSADGEAKVWTEPGIEVARSVGYDQSELNEIVKLVAEHRDEIRRQWQEHFA